MMATKGKYEHADDDVFCRATMNVDLASSNENSLFTYAFEWVFLCGA